MGKIFLSVCIVLVLSCTNTNKEETNVLNDNIKIIDGCEYIQFENSVTIGNNYNYTITHKGNCKNPIHVYTTTDTIKNGSTRHVDSR